MEVKVGKYTFVITENIESWNGITTNINYKIGGNIRDCGKPSFVNYVPLKGITPFTPLHI